MKINEVITPPMPTGDDARPVTGNEPMGTQQQQQQKTSTLNGFTIKAIADYIVKGNWAKAIALGALKAAPQLKAYLTADQWRVLNYAINTYGAVSFWNGLSAFASKVGVPTLSLAGWSSKLNQGEEEALEKIRAQQTGP